MTMTAAASNTVIDLSGDNDNPGALAALSNLPRLNSSSCETGFERACDNPECSAPKLISIVPKVESSEFITEPMVLNQPTLINGFTTVFQIDGVATRIDDQMNECTTGEGTGVNANTKTVFRVVPNTHAHIVNYVVVDGAGDTMRKIKENDGETMRKLLFSQRLSAEQMLKKLIAKALETPTRRANLVPVPVPAPIPAQTPVTAPAPIHDPASVKMTAPDTVPVSAPIRLPMKPVIKQAPNTVSKPMPKLPTRPVSKLISKPISKPVSTSKPVSKPIYKTVSQATPSTKEVLSIVPSGITVKIVSTESKQTPSKPSATASINTPTTNPIKKPYPATKPVIWQAVPSVAASKTTPTTTAINTTSPKASSFTSSGTDQYPVISSAKLASPSVASSQQTTPILPQTDIEPLDVENSIVAASIATRHRSQIASPNVTHEQTRAYKRKQDLTTPVQEAIKRLRPRSPTRKQNNVPLPSNIAKAPDTPTLTPTKKLATLSNKLPMRPVGPQKPKVTEMQQTSVDDLLIDTKDEVDTNEEDEVITPDTVPMSAISSNKKNTYATKEAVEQSQPEEIDTQPVRRKMKPIMGPASKMKALRDMADAKATTMTPKSDASNRCKPALVTESGPMKIGETTITRTGLSKIKENPPSATPTPRPGSITRPCSVAVTDIAKISTTTDSDSDSKSTRSTPRTTRRSTSDKDPNVKAKQVESLMGKLRSRWAFGKEDETSNSGKSDSPKLGRSTRSSIPKVNKETSQTTDANKSECDEVSDPTLLTTPSAPSKVMRVVLPPPMNKNDSPHPNLKISSIVSGDTALAATLGEADRETHTVTSDNKSSGGDIEKLQRELADLRRTVARLTHGKTT